MNFFGNLVFIRPWWFVALIPLGGLLWILARRRFSGSSWQSVCDARLLSFMLLGRTVGMKRKKMVFLSGLAGVLAITALAGPARERLPQPVMRDNTALILVVDLSLSMGAVDIKPDRLTRARFKIDDLLAQRKHGQTGLVVYARNAFTVVPVTDDNAAIELYLQSLDTDMMPRQGSRADLGLQEAFSLLQKVKAKNGDILLVTDYADARTVVQARQLKDKGYTVSIMGIGTESGGPVFLASGSFLSHKGEVVVPQLVDADLSEVAQAGGGIYARFDSFTNNDVQKLVEWFESRSVSAGSSEEEKATADVWREEGPWLLLLLLPFVLPGFRRGVLMIAMVALVAQPNFAYALDWEGLWLRRDQQASRALEKGEADRAAELFEDREWKAVAQHREGDFAGAVETLETLDDAANWYNKGNSLVGAGKLQEAIEAYRHALEIDPQMEDAIYNMGAVQKFIEQMQMQQMQNAQKSDKEDDGEPQEGMQSSAGESDEDQQNQESGDDETQGTDETNQEPSDEGTDEQNERDDGDREGDEAEQEDRDAETDGEEGKDTGEGGNDVADDGSSPETLTEKDQAIEQWLRGVKDNPGRLLKRKLKHLSRNKKDSGNSGDDPW